MDINILPILSKLDKKINIDPVGMAFNSASEQEKILLNTLQSWLVSAIGAKFPDSSDAMKVDIFNNLLDNLFNYSGSESDVTVDYILMLLAVASFDQSDDIYYSAVEATKSRIISSLTEIRDAVYVMVQDMTYILDQSDKTPSVFNTIAASADVNDLNSTISKIAALSCSGTSTAVDSIQVLCDRSKDLLTRIGVDNYESSINLITSRVKILEASASKVKGAYREAIGYAYGLNGSYRRYITNPPHMRAINYLSKVCESMMPQRAQDAKLHNLVSMAVLIELMTEIRSTIKSHQNEKSLEEPLGIPASELYYCLSLMSIFSFLAMVNTIRAGYMNYLTFGSSSAASKEALLSGIQAKAIKLLAEIEEAIVLASKITTNTNVDNDTLNFIVSKASGAGADMLVENIVKHRWDALAKSTGMSANSSSALSYNARVSSGIVLEDSTINAITTSIKPSSIAAPEFLVNLTKLNIVKNGNEVLGNSKEDNVKSRISKDVSKEIASINSLICLEAYNTSSVIAGLMQSEITTQSKDRIVDEIKRLSKSIISILDNSGLYSIENESVKVLNFVINSMLTNAALNILNVETSEEMTAVISYITDITTNFESIAKTIVLGGQ